MEQPANRTITLRDAGGLIIIWLFFGLPLGVIFDYVWNLVVLSTSLPLLKRYSTNTELPRIGHGRKLLYCLIITALGIVIDWAYFELTWDVGMGKGQLWAPLMSQPLQFLLLLLPMVMLALVNFALSYSYLKLDKKRAMILGAAMAFFTAPWLLPTIPYILKWTV
jgi:hypothetical protein